MKQELMMLKRQQPWRTFLMPKYILKPKPVEAIQWFPGDKDDRIEEIRHTTMGLVGRDKGSPSGRFVPPGWYYILESDGKITDIMPEDQFKRLYEEI